MNLSSIEVTRARELNGSARMTPGTLVQRSRRGLEQHGAVPQIGIVVGAQSSWEGEDWPLVHWEGRFEAEPCYPDHIEPITAEGLYNRARELASGTR